MKKLLALMMILMLAFVCCACGGDTEKKADTQEATESVPVTYTLEINADSYQEIDAVTLNKVKSILEARLAGAEGDYSVTVDEKDKLFTVTCLSSIETDLLTRKGVVAFVHPDGMPVMGNSDIESAEVQYDEQKKEYYIKLVFTEDGAEKFKELTTDSVGKTTEVYVDDEMICAPTVYAPITDGQVELRGDFSEQKAVTIANLMNNDALSFPLAIVEK